MPPDQRAATGVAQSEPLTSHELVVFPELAVLAALQQLLELTARTLAALHPKLVADRSCSRPLDLLAALADQIIELGACLGRAAICYRIAAVDSLHAPARTTFLSEQARGRFGADRMSAHKSGPRPAPQASRRSIRSTPYTYEIAF